MRKIIISALIFVSTLVMAMEPHFMKNPAISPDGETICFEYLSHLWLVDYEGGEAKSVTAGEGRNWNPIYSPDGKTIIFCSNRDHYNTIYQIAATGGNAIQISKESFVPLAWFPNGKAILVRGYEMGIGRNFIKLGLDGEFEIMTEFAGNNASFSPDGKQIIFDLRGISDREAYTGSHNGDLWLYDIPSNEYTRLTSTEYTEQYPNWAKSGKLYYAASDGDVFQLYSSEYHSNDHRDDLSNDLNNNLQLSQPKQLTKFKTWSVRNISLSQNERLVFEKFDELWRYNPERKKAEKIEIEIKQDLLGSFLKNENVVNEAKNYMVSPNGKLSVFSYKFDLFAVPEKGGDVKQITFNQPGIKSIAIMKDNCTIFFTAYEKGNLQLYKVNIKDLKNIEKISWGKGKFIETIYAQGNKLFLRYSQGEQRSNLAYADSLGNNIQPIVTDKLVRNKAALHSDGRYLFYISTRPDIWSHNLYLYDLESMTEELIYVFDGHVGQVRWGKDNKSILFNRNGNICRLDLEARDDFDQEEDNWKDILTEPDDKKQDDEDEDKNIKKNSNAEDEKDDKKKETKVELKIDKEGMAQRISTIIKRQGWNNVFHVYDDSTFYYFNINDGKYNLRKVSYFGENDKLIKSFDKRLTNAIYNEKNKSFYYVQNNIPHKLKGKKTSTIKLDYKYEYDRMQLNQDIFMQAWVAFGRGFYDKDMHGTKWKKAGKRFQKYMEFAYTPDIMRTIVAEMIGEVNASHTGFYSRKENSFRIWRTAGLGFVPDFKNFPESGIRVKKVYRKSKLNKPYDIKADDILLAIDGILVGKGANYGSLLQDKVGEKIELTFQTADSVKVVEIKGISYWSNYRLYYDNWVEERTKKVEALSDSRIGYLHIQAMSGSSYNKFLQDLFAKNYDKEALIIDVRNNGGGHIHDALLEVLTRKAYGKSSSRNTGGVPHNTPANTWEKPMVVLINENSFSDAEIFPSLFKQLGLGKVIGMPTSGSVIGTGHHYFMDGSSMRMPMNGWWLEDGTNMEGNGVQPDIEVEMTPEQIINDDDIQLKRAVDELLEQLAVSS